MIKVINSSIEKAEMKEKEPRCDFCFLREKDVVKCSVSYTLYRNASFIPIPLALPALPRIIEPLTSYVTVANTVFLRTLNASFVLFKMVIFLSLPTKVSFKLTVIST